MLPRQRALLRLQLIGILRDTESDETVAEVGLRQIQQPVDSLLSRLIDSPGSVLHVAPAATEVIGGGSQL